jgi:hypothetical protein
MDIFGPEIEFLEELGEELQSIFRVIAYAGYETNIKYIKDCQAEIEEKYGRFLDYVQSDAGQRFIIPAYLVLQDLLEGNRPPETIREECANALGDYLFLDDPECFSEDFVKSFGKFCQED